MKITQGFGHKSLTSLVTQTVKHLPTMQETQVRSLDWEGPLEKEMATQSCILAWTEDPMDGGSWQAPVRGVTKSQTDFTVSHKREEKAKVGLG